MRREFWDLAADARCAACKSQPAVRAFVAAAPGQSELQVARVCEECHATLLNAFLREAAAEPPADPESADAGSVA